MEDEEGVYRFVFAVNGTRGDFQPYLTFAKYLLSRGHRVKIYTAVNHAKAGNTLGVDCEYVSGDAAEGMTDDNAMRAMEAGDFVLIAKQSPEKENEEEKLIEGETREELIEKAKVSYTAFNPHVYLTNLLGDIGEVAALLPEVPRVMIALQQQAGPPTNSFKNMLFARDYPEPDIPNICSHVWFVQAQAQKTHENHQTCAWMLSEGQVDQEMFDAMPGADDHFASSFLTEEQYTPSLFAYSPSIFPPPDDWPEVNIIGRFHLSKEEQDAAAKSGKSFFTVGKDHEQCAEFLAAGPAPAYIGWGSMIVYGSEHMSKLAVEALKIANRRGIIVSGWAKLSRDDLDNHPELAEYADKNVLFVKTAPHEWLFPQCCCCVHHGGIGTMQASLGGGSPTIITPVFADQGNNAAALETGRWGIGTTKLGKLKAEELGAAIRTVCDDPSFKERTLDLKAKMEKENACERGGEILETFVREKVLTGKYKEEKSQFEAELRKKREKTVTLRWDQVLGKWNTFLNKKYPAYKDFNRRRMMFAGEVKETIDQGRCWFVKASSCLVRAGEGLKSPEVGRFKVNCFLEVVEKKGNRMRVKKIKGFGPDEGWVSPSASGKEILEQVTDLGMVTWIQTEMYNKLFADLQPADQ